MLLITIIYLIGVIVASIVDNVIKYKTYNWNVTLGDFFNFSYIFSWVYAIVAICFYGILKIEKANIWKTVIFKRKDK